MQMQVSLKIYDIVGREIVTILDNQTRSQGSHIITWNGKDKNNIDVNTGTYIYKLITNTQILTQKLQILK
jgi:flagellar hook assembly protein FlgD